MPVIFPCRSATGTLLCAERIRLRAAAPPRRSCRHSCYLLSNLSANLVEAVVRRYSLDRSFEPRQWYLGTLCLGCSQSLSGCASPCTQVSVPRRLRQGASYGCNRKLRLGTCLTCPEPSPISQTKRKLPNEAYLVEEPTHKRSVMDCQGSREGPGESQGPRTGGNGGPKPPGAVPPCFFAPGPSPWTSPETP